MGKSDRQQVLLEIIQNHEFSRQEDLQRELLKRGYATTQATVSRDIRELGLVKVQNRPGIYSYAVNTEEEVKSGGSPYAEIFSHSVLSLDYALNTVVLKCRTGMANAACAALDSMELSAVVGTLAGDDTIFMLMRTEEDAKIICRELVKLMR